MATETKNVVVVRPPPPGTWVPVTVYDLMQGLRPDNRPERIVQWFIDSRYTFVKSPPVYDPIQGKLLYHKDQKVPISANRYMDYRAQFQVLLDTIHNNGVLERLEFINWVERNKSRLVVPLVPFDPRTTNKSVQLQLHEYHQRWSVLWLTYLTECIYPAYSGDAYRSVVGDRLKRCQDDQLHRIELKWSHQEKLHAERINRTILSMRAISIYQYLLGAAYLSVAGQQMMYCDLSSIQFAPLSLSDTPVPPVEYGLLGISDTNPCTAYSMLTMLPVYGTKFLVFDNVTSMSNVWLCGNDVGNVTLRDYVDKVCV